MNERFEDMAGADRGLLLLLRGASGAGKFTFFDTISLVRQGVITERIPSSVDVGTTLEDSPCHSGPCVVVLEGREALHEVTTSEFEAALHSINAFV